MFSSLCLIVRIDIDRISSWYLGWIGSGNEVVLLNASCIITNILICRKIFQMWRSTTSSLNFLTKRMMREENVFLPFATNEITTLETHTRHALKIWRNVRYLNGYRIAMVWNYNYNTFNYHLEDVHSLVFALKKTNCYYHKVDPWINLFSFKFCRLVQCLK